MSQNLNPRDISRSTKIRPTQYNGKDPIGDERFWLGSLRMDIWQITIILNAVKEKPWNQPQPELEAGIKKLLEFIDELDKIAQSRK